MKIISVNVGLPGWCCGTANQCPPASSKSDIVKRFLVSERSGFYFSVLKEGEVGVGDELELIEKNASGVRVVDVTRLYSSDKENVDLLRRAISTQALPNRWRNYFLKRIEPLNPVGSRNE